MQNEYYIDEKKAILDYSSLYCETHEKLLRSELFFVVLSKYVNHLHPMESLLLEKIKKYLEMESIDELSEKMRILLRLLNSYTCTEIVEINPAYKGIKKVREYLIDYIDGLYNYWRKFERYWLLSGPETGAFLRPDDLLPGFAYEQINRSIFMNPHLTNARLIVPVTSCHKIVRGTPVDYIFYANNYEEIDDGHHMLEFFCRSAGSPDVFRSGCRKAKGTTPEKGLVESYFANPLNAPLRRNEHERIVIQYFYYSFSQGINVG